MPDDIVHRLKIVADTPLRMRQTLARELGAVEGDYVFVFEDGGVVVGRLASGEAAERVRDAVV